MAEQPIMNFHIQGDNHVYPTAAVVNNYFGDTVSATAMKLNLSQGHKTDEKKEEVADDLYAILQDKKLYEEVVTWAKTCKKTEDIRKRVCTPLKHKGIKFGQDFAKALIPHLAQYEGSKDAKNIARGLY